MSQSRISRIETGVTTPSSRDVEAIALALKLPAAELEALLSMLETSIQDWRGSVGSRLGALQEDIAQYEQAATTIRLLQTTLVPGLLQTAEYARSILTAYERIERTDPRKISDAIVKRIKRQQILLDAGKNIRIVFPESVLHYRLCSPSVMLSQIERIYEVSGFANVDLRIVPLMSELPAAVPHPVEIFDDTALTIDLALTALFSSGQADIAFYSSLFEDHFAAGSGEVGDLLNEAYQRFAKLAAVASPRLSGSARAVGDTRP